MALLEIEILQRLQWRIVPRPEALEDYYGNLVGRSEGFVIEGEGESNGEEADRGEDKGEGSGSSGLSASASDGRSTASLTRNLDVMDTDTGSMSE